MYQELLARVAEEQRRFDSEPQPPATEEELQLVVQNGSKQLHTELPGDYLHFLRLHNGLDWNGVVIYGAGSNPISKHADRSIADIVEMNLNYRDDPRFADLLVLGSNGMDIYTYRISTDRYEIYDEVPHELIESFPTFDELISKALSRSLQ
ncbi:MAG TPA: YrhA family protein [Pyrinomonadaceae bacterium]|nr:YrhA family protein [Pyrinomonadaceae bacterium]